MSNPIDLDEARKLAAEAIDGAARKRNVLEDVFHAAQRGASAVLRHEGTPTLEEIRAQIAKARADGAIIVGCSFCARKRPTGGSPRPCPVCDRLVSPRKGADGGPLTARSTT